MCIPAFGSYNCRDPPKPWDEMAAKQKQKHSNIIKNGPRSSLGLSLASPCAKLI